MLPAEAGSLVRMRSTTAAAAYQGPPGVDRVVPALACFGEGEQIGLWTLSVGGVLTV